MSASRIIVREYLKAYCGRACHRQISKAHQFQKARSMKINKIYLTFLVVCTLLISYANLAEATKTIFPKPFKSGDTLADSYLDDPEDFHMWWEGKKNEVAYEYRIFPKLLIGLVANEEYKEVGKMSLLSGDWYIKCDIDLMTDQKSCILKISKGREPMFPLVFIFLENHSLEGICIGAKHYPGSKIFLRVDKNPPHSAPAKQKCFINTSKILKEIRAGKVVKTRFQKWPSKSLVDHEISTYGLPLAIELAKWLLKYKF